MDMRRRQFLWGGAVIAGGTLLGLTAADLVSPAEGQSFDGSADGRFPQRRGPWARRRRPTGSMTI